MNNIEEYHTSNHFNLPKINFEKRTIFYAKNGIIEKRKLTIIFFKKNQFD